MSKQPIRDKRQIDPARPDTEQQPVKPEIPPNKDAPEKKTPVKAA
jgi:hypothetical protein